MPFSIKKVNNEFELRLKDTNQLLGKHKTKQSAKSQIMAIEAQKNNPSKLIDGYRFFKSEKPNKKLKVKINNKWIHFGDNRYEHYYDKTGLLDKSLNHGNDLRRKRYLQRATKIKDKEGNYTVNDKNSANYWAVRLLW
jgi:hypothetical protein